jgi:hypothetical protein
LAARAPRKIAPNFLQSRHPFVNPRLTFHACALRFELNCTCSSRGPRNPSPPSTLGGLTTFGRSFRECCGLSTTNRPSFSGILSLLLDNYLLRFGFKGPPRHSGALFFFGFTLPSSLRVTVRHLAQSLRPRPLRGLFLSAQFNVSECSRARSIATAPTVSCTSDLIRARQAPPERAEARRHGQVQGRVIADLASRWHMVVVGHILTSANPRLSARWAGTWRVDSLPLAPTSPPFLA